MYFYFLFQALNAGVDISDEDQDVAEDLLIEENMRQVEAFEKNGGTDIHMFFVMFTIT